MGAKFPPRPRPPSLQGSWMNTSTPIRVTRPPTPRPRPSHPSIPPGLHQYPLHQTYPCKYPLPPPSRPFPRRRHSHTIITPLAASCTPSGPLPRCGYGMARATILTGAAALTLPARSRPRPSRADHVRAGPRPQPQTPHTLPRPYPPCPPRPSHPKATPFPTATPRRRKTRSAGRRESRAHGSGRRAHARTPCPPRCPLSDRT